MANEKTICPRSRWRPFVVPAVLLVAVLLLVGHLLLPLAAERVFLPQVFKAAGIREYHLPVRRLDFFGMNLGALRIGPETAPGIVVASFSAAYHPGGLMRRRVARVTLAGVRILVRANQEGGFEIPGLPEITTGSEGDHAGPPQPLPVAVAEIHVKQGEVVLQRGEDRLRVPFEVTVRPEPDMSVFEGTIRLALPNRWATVNTRVDLGANRVWADWEGRGIRLGMLGVLAALQDRLTVTGSGHTRGRVRARLTPFEVESLDMTLRHTPCRLNWDDVRLDLSGATPHEDLQMTITSQDAGNWAIQSAAIRVAVPGGEGRITLTGTLEQGDRGLAWAGRLASLLTIDPFRSGLPALTLPLNLETTAQFPLDGRWQARLNHLATEAAGAAMVVDTGKPAVRLAAAKFEASAEGHGDTLKADAQWRLPGLMIGQNGVRLRVGAVAGEAAYRREADAGEGAAALRLGAIALTSKGVSARLQEVQLTGGGTLGPDAPLRLTGRITASGGSATFEAPGVKAAGFQARLPLVWPPPEKGPSGTFSLTSATWKGKALGSVAGRLRQTMEGVSLQAYHDNRFVPGLRVEAGGTAGLSSDDKAPFARVRWTAERPAEAGPLAVSELMPDPPEIPITFSGRLFARGEVTYANGLSGALTAGVEGGRLQVDEQGIVIDGIHTSLAITDLVTMRSAPAQRLSFDTLTFGSIRASEGQLAYQIEPGKVLFLEEGRFRWSGGAVIAPATRFVPGGGRYDITVYCDRLKLNQLLEQLGLAQVEGGGAISGLIPVSLADGRLTFNNAFLYSTPGEGGVIRVQGSEVLTAGIPPGTPQYNQVELARHALKDYDYEWARVTMNSVADDLLLQLQFDGKPAAALPFIYDPAAGGFVKTEAGRPGSVFQGIRLDVNVTLPLNRMLRYRELFQRLQ